MVRSEIGKRPLLVDRISRSALYIKHVALKIGTLANTALDNELSFFDDSDILCLTRNISHYYNSYTNYQIPKGKTKLKKLATQRYDEIWSLGLSTMSKADTYRSVKPFKQYLCVVKTSNCSITSKTKLAPSTN